MFAELIMIFLLGINVVDCAIMICVSTVLHQEEK
jgi:hypothetical protein